MTQFKFDKAKFQKTKKEAEAFYKNIKSIECPYFSEKISFNSTGLKHLKFKSERKARPQKDQYPRLRLLHLAPEILKKSHTLQGIWVTECFESQKTNSRWEHKMKKVTFYEFIAVLKNIRIKIIIKEVVGEKKYFWSIIPFWGIDRLAQKRVLYNGNPKND